ncbi:hypothetical protein CYMTET_33110 [Cymbomonas tetramitiformis]|uniref:Uncharacterized protein n=1 Tax=Cymbomonas tetramitiformis TaxID=36881 RepID=A0AAE0FDK4_9CHLO|nr:hypothetical protein CYMTET_33110 [Cymbomonas tetramitiformis]
MPESPVNQRFKEGRKSCLTLFQGPVHRRVETALLLLGHCGLLILVLLTWLSTHPTEGLYGYLRGHVVGPLTFAVSIYFLAVCYNVAYLHAVAKRTPPPSADIEDTTEVEETSPASYKSVQLSLLSTDDPANDSLCDKEKDGGEIIGKQTRSFQETARDCAASASRVFGLNQPWVLAVLFVHLVALLLPLFLCLPLAGDLRGGLIEDRFNDHTTQAPRALNTPFNFGKWLVGPHSPKEPDPDATLTYFNISTSPRCPDADCVGSGRGIRKWKPYLEMDVYRPLSILGLVWLSIQGEQESKCTMLRRARLGDPLHGGLFLWGFTAAPSDISGLVLVGLHCSLVTLSGLSNCGAFTALVTLSGEKNCPSGLAHWQ